MTALITALLSLFNWVGQYFAQQQLLDAGKAEQQVHEQAKVETNVHQAEMATTVPDPVRTERLRTRFDDASS